VRALGETSLGLFSICVLLAAMGLLAQDGRASLPFRSACALAGTLCALRMVSHLF